MSADAIITRDGPVNVPLDYAVPATSEIIPIAISATFADPTNAGPYVPALEVITQTGQVVGPFPLGESIAAGGSARVSWFPGVGGGASGGIQALVGARIEAHAPQSIATSTTTDVVYDTVAFDTDGMANLAANSRILTISTPGLYLIVCETTWDANTAGRRLNGITVNGYTSGGSPFLATDSRNAIFTPPASPGHTPNTSVGVFNLAAGDFVASGCLQGSGGSLNCNGLQAGSNQDNFLSALLIGST